MYTRLMLSFLLLPFFGFYLQKPDTDHWDGPAVMKEPAADITDFFAFPTGENKLVLIMSVYPGATPQTKFSDAVLYSIRLRPISQIRQNPIKPIFSDIEYQVRFMADSKKSQSVHCEVVEIRDGKEIILSTTRVRANQKDGGNNEKLKLFAGNRADQSFTDLARVRLPVWRDTGFNNRPGLNGLAGKNVLSLVAEMNFDFIGKQLWAAVAQTQLVSIDKKELRQIDKMGRLEMTVFVITTDTLKDLWNQEDAFNVKPENAALYQAELQKGLFRLDNFEKSLDNSNVVDWPVPHPWIELFLNDFLIVNTALVTKADNTEIHYLDIELQATLGLPISSVGGRTPNEDVIKQMLTLLINGPRRPFPDRGVGVPAPDRPADSTFPFVQPSFK